MYHLIDQENNMQNKNNIDSSLLSEKVFYEQAKHSMTLKNEEGGFLPLAKFTSVEDDLKISEQIEFKTKYIDLHDAQSTMSDEIIEPRIQASLSQSYEEMKFSLDYTGQPIAHSDHMASELINNKLFAFEGGDVFNGAGSPFWVESFSRNDGLFGPKVHDLAWDASSYDKIEMRADSDLFHLHSHHNSNMIEVAGKTPLIFGGFDPADIISAADQNTLMYKSIQYFGEFIYSLYQGNHFEFDSVLFSMLERLVSDYFKQEFRDYALWHDHEPNVTNHPDAFLVANGSEMGNNFFLDHNENSIHLSNMEVSAILPSDVLDDHQALGELNSSMMI